MIITILREPDMGSVSLPVGTVVDMVPVLAAPLIASGEAVATPDATATVSVPSPGGGGTWGGIIGAIVDQADLAAELAARVSKSAPVFDGAIVTPANAMAALAIATDEPLNTKSISADSTLTFSGAPATANTWFSLHLINTDASPHVITIPSSYSMDLQAAITSFVIPASGRVNLTWRWDGSGYSVWGVPGALDNLSATTAPTVNDDAADGYAIGSRWTNTAADDTYECTDASLGAAVWKQTNNTATSDTAEADVASAGTTDIGAASSRSVRITGTTTITSFGTVAAGTQRDVRFAGSLTLTNSAGLSLPGGANFKTAPGDCADALSMGSGNWVIRSIRRAKGGKTVYNCGAISDVTTGGGSNQVSARINVPPYALAPEGFGILRVVIDRSGSTDTLVTSTRIGTQGQAFNAMTALCAINLTSTQVRFVLECLVLGNRADYSTVKAQVTGSTGDPTGAFTSANALTITLDTSAAAGWDFACGGNAGATDAYRVIGMEFEVSNPQ